MIDKRRIMLFAITVFVCLSITGCSFGEGSDVAPNPFFPVEKEKRLIYMEARNEGKLILSKGCIRLKPTFNDSLLIIWPYGYKLQIEGRTIHILNANGQVMANVGDWVAISGGESKSIESVSVEKNIGQPLPSDCTGPFWLAGGVISE